MGSQDELIVLALNVGSSSLKFGVYKLVGFQLEKLHGESIQGTDTQSAIDHIFKSLTDKDLPSPDVIGHRIVHGGLLIRRHCLIDSNIIRQLQKAADFAPLHNEKALALIQAVIDRLPTIPQMACLDTVFHADLPDISRSLPIPSSLRSEGIKRYGFHGLSCESIVQQLGKDLPPRVIVAHLGNGVSVTAIKDGISIDTSMSLTPSGGAIMGSRSGDIDPGVLLYLLRKKDLSTIELEYLIDKRAGLLGISCVSSDMRELHASAENNEDVLLAIRMFCYSVGKLIASMAVALKGADLLVFTGGIGEHDPEVRERICQHLEWMDIRLNHRLNQENNRTISDDTSLIAIEVLPSKEEDQIARHAARLC